MQSVIRKLVLLPVALVLPGYYAHATTIQYTSVSTWKSNVTGNVELDFNAVSSSGNYSDSTGKTLSPLGGGSIPVKFTGPVGSGYQLTGGWYTASNYISLLGPSGGTGNITVTFPVSGENAFMIGLGSTGAATSITVTLSDGEVFNVPATANALEFFGVSVSHEISWLTLTSSSQTVIDDFYVGGSKLPQDAAPSAEVATFLMLGSGLVLLYGGRRKLFGATQAA